MRYFGLVQIGVKIGRTFHRCQIANEMVELWVTKDRYIDAFQCEYYLKRDSKDPRIMLAIPVKKLQ